MVYDAFMFLDEIDLLEIRLNVLNDVVDYFVITESTETQIGEKKDLVFPKHCDRFSNFNNKIIYNVCDSSGKSFESQWKRERYQRDSMAEGLKEASDRDVLIMGDLDEIPNPIEVRKITDSFDDSVMYHFAQRMFYFYINYENVENHLLASCGDFEDASPKMWIGTKLTSVGRARKITMTQVRRKERMSEPGVRIADGGWHFSYMGGCGEGSYKRIKRKLRSFSHADEFGNARYYNRFHINHAIRTGKDLLGRDAIFKKVPIDERYPEWLRIHYKEYPHLILK